MTLKLETPTYSVKRDIGDEGGKREWQHQEPECPA